MKFKEDPNNPFGMCPSIPIIIVVIIIIPTTIAYTIAYII